MPISNRGTAHAAAGRRVSRLFGMSILLCSALLISSQGAVADFTQQGAKLVATGAALPSEQGYSVALSADGNTAIIGARADNGNIGAAWVFTRSGAVWSQQGSKLVGIDAVGASNQGQSVAMSADGNTAIVGGYLDNGGAGAAWVYVRSGGVWTQQGSKLLGAGAVGAGNQGLSVALSADGNTAFVGGHTDNGGAGAAWVFTRSGSVWTQQGDKLVGSGAVGNAGLGASVALSADGNTAIVGADSDNGGAGAAWVFTRSGGVWTEQGAKLVGTGAAGLAQQGFSVALSADGNTAIVGGDFDNNFITGAAWIFTRSGEVWSQQGPKLVGSGGVGTPNQGKGVALSGDGLTAIVGGNGDSNGLGATWVWTASGGVWTQQGAKLVGSGAAGPAHQGTSVALSGDGNTAMVGGFSDGSNTGVSIGATWVFVQQSALVLQVSPTTDISASGPRGGPFMPTSFEYQISASNGTVDFSIAGIPAWLNPSFVYGTANASPTTVTFSLTNVATLGAGTYNATINFTNTTNGQGSTSRTATLTVLPGKDDCKSGGWQNFPAPPGPFKNQGQCVSFFARGN
jgi:hypothetical protein